MLPEDVYASRLSEPPSESTPVNMLLTVSPSPFSSPPLVKATPTPRLPAPAKVAADDTVMTPPSACSIGKSLVPAVDRSDAVR